MVIFRNRAMKGLELECPNCSENTAELVMDSHGKQEITFCDSCGYTKEEEFPDEDGNPGLTYRVDKPYGAYTILRKSSQSKWKGTIVDESYFLQLQQSAEEDEDIIQIKVSRFIKGVGIKISNLLN